MKQVVLIAAAAVTLAACGGGGGGMSAVSSNDGRLTISHTPDNPTGSVTFHANVNLHRNNDQGGEINGRTALYVTTDYTASGTIDGESATVSETSNNYIYAADIDRADSHVFDDEINAVVASLPYAVNGTVQYEDVSHIGIVRGANEDHFFITNQATGGADRDSTRPSEIGYQFTPIQGTTPQMVKEAHQQGWTGKGKYVAGAGWNTDAGSADILTTLPIGATIEFHDSNTAQVCDYNQTYNTRSDCINIATEDTGAENALAASVTAVVGHKFDTLSNLQAYDIVDQTRDNDGINLRRALSPVGNLR